jgi:hypothetical protein
MRRRLRATLTIAIALAACTDGSPAPRAAPTGTPTPPSVTLVAENVLLPTGPENAVRIGFDAFDPSARVIVRDSPASAAGAQTEAPAVALCPLAHTADSLPPLTECALADPGVRAELTGDRALGGLAIISRGDRLAAVTVVLEYSEGSRAVSVRMPLIRQGPGASACKDNACNPFFEVLPSRGGEFRASATWSGGEARLVLLSGRVRARSFSATGVPYGEPAGGDGPPPLRIRTRLSSPAEYALALTAIDGDLSAVTVEASWPG